MKTGFCKLTLIAMLASSLQTGAADFKGAKAEPIGKTKSPWLS